MNPVIFQKVKLYAVHIYIMIVHLPEIVKEKLVLRDLG